MQPKQRLNKIVEHAMCIGCGICESLAGKDSITMQVVDNGYERPTLNIASPLRENQIEIIEQVCPGIVVKDLPAELVDADTKTDLVWGAYRDIYYAYSAEPSVRHIAATGGLLTALTLYLIESDSVDFILHAKANRQHPSFGEPTISRTRHDILQAAGSRYGPTATLRDIVAILDACQTKWEYFAFVGTPCDVNALRAYAQLDSRVDTHCLFMLTMVCGGFMAPKAMRDFVESQSINYQEVSEVRYRGNGCPGPTTLTMQDKSVHEFTYLDFWGEDDTAWHLPPRCKLCTDGVGEAADVAASDTWQGGAPTLDEMQNDLGRNAAVVRTHRGQELLTKAIEAGYVKREDDLSTDKMSQFQPHQEAKKRALWARFEGMQQAGHLYPRPDSKTNGLRLKRLWQNNSSEENSGETQGAYERCQSGKFSEVI